MTRVTHTDFAWEYTPNVLSITTQAPATTHSLHPEWAAGTALSNYTIVSRLGEGGQGVVYAARDEKLGRRVALKFLRPQCAGDEGARQRFIREAETAAAVQHHNICTIYGIEFAEDGRPVIVMGYYEGQTLKQKLHEGALRVPEAIEIAAQIAEGLAAAHAQGVVHRDVKPANLMITTDGVRILDFGIAMPADSLHLTAERSIVGTVTYMSPEQTRGEQVSVLSDVWSAGVVLYEMLAGRPPFRGTHSDAICYAIRNDPPPRLSTPALRIPAELERIVFRALCKDSRHRLRSASEMARALRCLQAEGTARASIRSSVLWPVAIRPSVQSWRSFCTALTPSRTALLTAAGVAARAFKAPRIAPTRANNF